MQSLQITSGSMDFSFLLRMASCFINSLNLVAVVIEISSSLKCRSTQISFGLLTVKIAFGSFGYGSLEQFGFAQVDKGYYQRLRCFKLET